MASKTHNEIVLDEIVRQFPDRVNARARLMERPLGTDDVSDAKARELYWQRNPNPQAVLMAVQQNPEMSDWEITKLIYTNRAAVLESVKNTQGTQAMIRFEKRMNEQGPPVDVLPMQGMPMSQPQAQAPREEPAGAY